MKSYFVAAVLTLNMLYVTSCDRPKCNNTNPIFDDYAPNTEIYKNELAQRLEKIDRKELTYWFQKYDDKNTSDALYFHIQNEDLCAVLHLHLAHWEKLENLRNTKGVGYRGAEFINLQFHVIKDANSTKFVYSTFDRIID